MGILGWHTPLVHTILAITACLCTDAGSEAPQCSSLDRLAVTGSLDVAPTAFSGVIEGRVIQLMSVMLTMAVCRLRMRLLRDISTDTEAAMETLADVCEHG